MPLRFIRDTNTCVCILRESYEQGNEEREDGEFEGPKNFRIGIIFVQERDELVVTGRHYDRQ